MFRLPLSRRRRTRPNRFAPSIDPLEPRALMAAVPVAVAPRVDVAEPIDADPGAPDIGDEVGDGTSTPVVSPENRARPRLTPRVVRELNAAIDRVRAENILPSLAVGIWVPSSGRFLAVRGATQLDGNRPRSPSDPFRIASITKTFTATAVLQLADRGKLSVSDPISKYFPGFPNGDKITVDDLLRMRSGIPDVLGPSLLEAYYANPRLRFGAKAVVAAATARADEFVPAGGPTVYNNTNYVMLGEVVRQVTGRSLGEQIQRTISRPLGLHATSYPTTDRLASPLRGYSLDATTGRYVDKTELNPIVAGGAGAMVSSLRDLRVYARALATGSLLRRSSQQARLEGNPIEGAPSFVRYGQGIEQIGRFVGHNGTIFGFSSEMFYLPALRATIVINVNRLDVDDRSQSTDLFINLTKIAFPEYVNW